MNSVLLYSIRCPKCQESIVLLGTSLAVIIQCRQVPNTDAPFLVFVCSHYKAASQYEYEKLPALGVTEHTSNRKYPACFSVVTADLL